MKVVLRCFVAKVAVCILIVSLSGCKFGSSGNQLRLKPLTADKRGKEEVIYEFPTASPDGKYLVYQFSADPRSVDVGAADAKEEKGKKRETRIDFPDELSKWHVYRVNTDGTGKVLLSGEEGGDQAIWAPDSKTLVYRIRFGERFVFYRMDKDGKGREPLFKQDIDSLPTRFRDKTPAFSQDGEKIVFYSNRKSMLTPKAERGRDWHLFMTDKDGQNVVQITDDPFKDRHPQFSLDGKKIIFHSNREDFVTSTKNDPRVWFFDIYSLDLETKELLLLTPGQEPIDYRHPFVSPDGKYVAYHGNVYRQHRSKAKRHVRIARDLFIMTTTLQLSPRRTKRVPLGSWAAWWIWEPWNFSPPRRIWKWLPWLVLPWA